jgi:hypothetical protein
VLVEAVHPTVPAAETYSRRGDIPSKHNHRPNFKRHLKDMKKERKMEEMAEGLRNKGEVKFLYILN